jgi:pimeloyl-ACP methyl ester carboxylesterase
MTRPEPFRIAVGDEVLDDLRARLRQTRWPDQLADVGWEHGTDITYLRRLVDHWSDGFDWRAQEARLNDLPSFRASVDGTVLHYVHQPGSAPGAMPVLLLHGWPSSFVQMLDLLALLADPVRHGAHASDSFDVVVASLPGYGFSQRAGRRGMGAARMGELFHGLMTEVLGYGRYAIRGSDFGENVLTQMAARHPEAVIGTHTAGPTPVLGTLPDDLTDEERRYVGAVERWRETEQGYAVAQGTRPQTLAYGLNDSPVGLAAWLVEKFRSWSDCDGVLDRRFTMDELLVDITIYWVTETIGSSIRLYGEAQDDPSASAPDVPAAFLVSSKDMVAAPRSWAERTARVDRWTEVGRGGHFMEWEEPQMVAEDMRAFFRALRTSP